MGLFSRVDPMIDEELRDVRREARNLLQRNNAAAHVIDAFLVQYGASGHPLVDALLEARHALRQQ